ncbi:putative glycolipid-binding domain-containing protein [Gordonia sp. PP30]|uniref:putative glycolipid-binding domain-containing protein n=1 Tax=unclassified Gordonia (in: high G+C Gram-positive bacteria) TaxID=2657482 RepID=UPI001FFF6913|nr:putative glycolipid-binding domain-containing protein [Gordonia sp. PP30]UQE75298.1 putative glycolipid-binding domain-containing protein [Gordonia sp. PP30]
MTSREPSNDVKTMLTWRGADAERIEQVRMNISDARIRAYGRIISAATDEHEAYSVSYELVTNDSGVTRRLSVRMLRASGETQLDISRDMDGRWMVQTPDSVVHSDFGGADTVDLWHSPFLKSLVIRRFGLLGGQSVVDIPVVELSLPGCSVDVIEKSYTFDGLGTAAGAATLTSARGTWDLRVDEAGLVTTFTGIAERI